MGGVGAAGTAGAGWDLEALALIDGVGQLRERVCKLAPVHEELEPLREPLLVAVRLGQRRNLHRVLRHKRRLRRASVSADDGIPSKHALSLGMTFQDAWNDIQSTHSDVQCHRKSSVAAPVSAHRLQEKAPTELSSSQLGLWFVSG